MSGASHPASSIRCLISGTAAAASGTLTVTRTISDPACHSSMHCFAVRRGIRRVGHRHRLDDHGRAAADDEGTDADAGGAMAVVQGNHGIGELAFFGPAVAGQRTLDVLGTKQRQREVVELLDAVGDLVDEERHGVRRAARQQHAPARGRRLRGPSATGRWRLSCPRLLRIQRRGVACRGVEPAEHGGGPAAFGEADDRGRRRPGPRPRSPRPRARRAVTSRRRRCARPGRGARVRASRSVPGLNGLGTVSAPVGPDHLEPGAVGRAEPRVDVGRDAAGKSQQARELLVHAGRPPLRRPEDHLGIVARRRRQA